MGYSSAAKSKKKGKDKKEDMQSTGIAGAKCSASDADSFDEILRAGSALFNRNFAAAEDCYRLALNKQPGHTTAMYNLGLTQMNQGKHDAAISQFKKTIKSAPNYGEAYFGLGSTQYDQASRAGDSGLMFKAADNLKKAINLSPSMFAAFNQLGNVYLALQDYGRAGDAYRSVTQISPRQPEGYANLARVLLMQGKGQEALQASQRAIDISPANGLLYHELGTAYKSIGREAEAKRMWKTAIRLIPNHAPSHYQIGELMAGTVFTEDKDIPGAMRSLAKAIQLDPNLAEAYMSLGMLHWGQGRMHLARDLLSKGLQVRPFAEGAANLGIVLSDLGDYEGAIKAFTQAMELNPRLAEAPKCLGDTYKHMNRWKDAIKMYKKALSIRPEYWEALNDLVHALQHTCEWKEWEKKLRLLQVQLSRELAAGGKPLFVKPFHALVYPLRVDHMLLVAESYAARAIRLVKSMLPSPFPVHKGLGESKKLRVGWVSSNIGDHSLSHLMRSVFLMQGDRIETWVFPLNGDNDPGDPVWREQIRKGVGPKRFVEISQVSGVQAAHIVNKHKIHVLIDLVGYTGGGERANEVFASRPAALQTSYMGFCASTGAPYMQHMIADRVVAPPEYRAQFSERLMLLPYSYFCNDHRQQPAWADIPSAAVSRSMHSELPKEGILLACFNQLYKMDPPVFDVWMQVLKSNPNTYLWLLKFPPVAVENIKKEAQKAGVEEHRVVFGNTLPKKEYLERGALADLFLDTPLVNAHTSATDILWAGVPMVTTGRESMISRVASSLCLAAGRPEMVAINLQEYQSLVNQLVGKGTEASSGLVSLKAATLRSKHASPLFDTQLWVKHLDASLLMAWDSLVALQRTGQDFHVIVRATC